MKLTKRKPGEDGRVLFEREKEQCGFYEQRGAFGTVTLENKSATSSDCDSSRQKGSGCVQFHSYFSRKGNCCVGKGLKFKKAFNTNAVSAFFGLLPNLYVNFIELNYCCCCFKICFDFEIVNCGVCICKWQQRM